MLEYGRSSSFFFQKDRDRHIRRDHSEEVYELSFCPKCQKVIALEDSAAHCLLHISEKYFCFLLSILLSFFFQHS